MVCSTADKSIPTEPRLGSRGSCWWSPPTQKQLSDSSVTEHRGKSEPPADATELSATSLRCVLIRSEAVSLHWCLGGGTKTRVEEGAWLASPCPLLCTTQELISRRLTVAQGDVERIVMCVCVCQRGRERRRGRCLFI